VQVFRPMRRHLLLPLALCLLLLAGLAAGCGSDDGTGSSTSASSSASSSTADTATKPDVAPPNGPAPEKLVVKDLVEGTGATAEPGNLVTVQYVGVDYDSGKQFDASWDNGEPFSFLLGNGEVIDGWDEGIVGMKVGGRRELIIPPDQAYGKQGSGSIGPNATLVFVVDLLSVG
jgi:peptidylprolyl isomerase